MSWDTFRLTPAAPCEAIARTTSRSVNMPTAVLPSVQTTSLTTSALIQLGGDTHGLVHANRDYAGRSLLAQEISDLHGNLLKGKLLGLIHYIKCQHLCTC